MITMQEEMTDKNKQALDALQKNSQFGGSYDVSCADILSTEQYETIRTALTAPQPEVITVVQIVDRYFSRDWTDWYAMADAMREDFKCLPVIIKGDE